MKSFNVTFVSFLLSFSTLGVVYTQSAPQLAFSVNSGITRSGLPIQFGLRGKLSQHLALNAQIGNAPWKYKQNEKLEIATNVTLEKLKIRSQFTFTSDLRAYTNPGQQGLYTGFGFLRQQIKMETETKLHSNNGNSINPWNPLGFIIAIFNQDRGTTTERKDEAWLNAIAVDIGYAHVLRDDSRLEIGLRFIDRNIEGVQYFVLTYDEPKAFDLNKIAKPTELTAEIRYVVPIL